MLTDTLWQHYVFTRDWKLFPTACVIATFGFLVLFFWIGRVKFTPLAQADLRSVGLGEATASVGTNRGDKPPNANSDANPQSA